MALSPVAQKAKELRKELKEVFSLVKFKVTSENSGGAAINVSWVDGVTRDQVEAIANKYSSISRCQFSGEILSGGNTYLSCNREYSIENYTVALAAACKKWGLPVPEVSVNEYDNTPYLATASDTRNVGNSSRNLSELVLKELAGIDFTLVPAIEVKKVSLEVAIEPEVQISEDGEAVSEVLSDVLEARRDRMTEKRDRQTEAYTRLSASHRDASDAACLGASTLSSMIPFGQPILVDHHSAGRHRRDIGRINSGMRKSIEHAKTADYYAGKLANLDSNTAISSDDPDALEKLRAKLEGMEECQEYMKRINGFIRKVAKFPEGDRVAKMAELSGLTTEAAAAYLAPDYSGRTGLAHYRPFQLSNNSANMKRVKDRITQIERQHQAIADSGESSRVEYPELGLKVVTNRAVNRLQLIFDGKPTESIRTELKSCGFRWSPSEGAWQRQISNSAEWQAERMVKLLRTKEI